MRFSVLLIVSIITFCSCTKEAGKETTAGSPEQIPEPLAIGYSVPMKDITGGKLAYARSVGIDHVEISGMKFFVDDNRNFLLSDEQMTETLSNVKKAADDAGMNIWSIHMPYGANIDLSLTDEADRQAVVEVHQKLLEYLKILEPEIILFHPSYYLGLNERDIRKMQMIKSAKALNESVQAIGATMVIENMLGPELLRDENRERPLMRTVGETVEIMHELPGSVYSAIDMNHIQHPERLIRAMGSRLKSVHIADGSGKQENHYFPCSGEGDNNWIEILAALHEVGYDGPFLFECAFGDEKDLTECYETLHGQFVRTFTRFRKEIDDQHNGHGL